MKIIRQAAELIPESKPLYGAIGVFDGVHLGHQKVLSLAQAQARAHNGLSMAITFDRHPLSVVAPTRAPSMIYTLEKKLQTLETLGLDMALVLAFDESFSRLTAEAFVEFLATQFGPLKHIIVGGNFAFGHQRKGNVTLLKELGPHWGFEVTGAEPELHEGHAISSTRIRKAVHGGYFALASRMLGRPYSLQSRIVRGDGIGAKLGFPTANFDIASLLIPPGGVYAVRARLGDQWHPAVLNIGYRPTLKLPEPQLRVEAHLLDFDGDLYGSELELVLAHKIRDEMRFDNLGALQQQITQDIAAARKLLKPAL